MATHSGVWTADMLDDVPDDGQRWEVISGRLLVTPAPDIPHQLVVTELVGRLFHYLSQVTDARVVSSPSDVQRGPETRMQPDAFVVVLRDGKLPKYPFAMSELLLTIEVVSPSSEDADRNDRRIAYLAGGVPEYWIVDRVARHVERWRTGDEQPEIVMDVLSFQAPGIDQPLEIILPKLFANTSDVL